MKQGITKRVSSDRFSEIRSGPNVIRAVQSGNTFTNYSSGPVALPITSRYTKPCVEQSVTAYARLNTFPMLLSDIFCCTGPRLETNTFLWPPTPNATPGMRPPLPPTLRPRVFSLFLLLWLNVIRKHIKLCHATFQHRFHSFCCFYLFCRAKRPAERRDKLPCSHYTFRLFLSPSRLVPPNSCFPWQYK